jgi:anti-sigma regulatory factor (Ser/Thr protein kinase)
MPRSIRLAPAVAQLDRLRCFLGRELQDLDPGHGARPELLIAATEVFVNACEHARVPPGSQVHVRLQRAANEVQVTLHYPGVRFVTRGFAPPDPAALPERGLGLFVANQLVDGLEFTPSRSPHGMQRVLLRKHLR